MWLWLLFAAFMIISILVYLISPLFLPKSIELKDSHVLVTGGSSGIGKAIASKALRSGAKVTIIARNTVKLEQARAELVTSVEGGDQKVQAVSVDLTTNYAAIETKIKECQVTFGLISVLVNCAGGAMPGRFDEVPLSDFQTMISLNYLTAIHATRAVLPSLKARGGGRVVLISSQAGQLGLFGFSAYSAAKFALKGLAESLQMEVKPYDIHVTLAFPPDTDTPGLQEEMKSKPEETLLISETSGLFSADYVAGKILSDAVKGRFYCSIGVDGQMLSNLTCGFSPVISLLDAIQQIVTMGLFRLIALFYLAHFDRIVYNCKRKRDSVDSKNKNE